MPDKETSETVQRTPNSGSATLSAEESNCGVTSVVEPEQIFTELSGVLVPVADDATVQPTEGVSEENRLNRDRLLWYRERHERDFVALLRESDFEYGFESAADRYVQERFAENTSATLEWIGHLFVERFADSAITLGIVRVMAHMEYAEAKPHGVTIAISATRHPDAEVRECGVRAFENWGTRDSLELLRTLAFDEPWLQEYVEQVVEDLTPQVSREPAG